MAAIVISCFAAYGIRAWLRDMGYNKGEDDMRFYWAVIIVWALYVCWILWG